MQLADVAAKQPANTVGMAVKFLSPCIEHLVGELLVSSSFALEASVRLAVGGAGWTTRMVAGAITCSACSKQAAELHILGAVSSDKDIVAEAKDAHDRVDEGADTVVTEA